MLFKLKQTNILECNLIYRSSGNGQKNLGMYPGSSMSNCIASKVQVQLGTPTSCSTTNIDDYPYFLFTFKAAISITKIVFVLEIKQN